MLPQVSNVAKTHSEKYRPAVMLYQLIKITDFYHFGRVRSPIATRVARHL